VVLIFSSALTSALGVVFWALVARQYQTDQVGIITSLLNVLGFLSSISLYGLAESIIRFLPSSKDSQILVNTSVTLSIVSSSVVSAISIPLLVIYDPNFSIILEDNIGKLLFVICSLSMVVGIIQDSVFIARRKASYLLIRNVSMGVSKLIMVILLSGYGAIGLLASIAVSSVMSNIIAIFLSNNIGVRLRIGISSRIKEWRKFALANYLSGLIASVVLLIIPLEIMRNLGPRYSAYYFIAYIISTALRFIPQGVTKSMFAEASNSIKDIKNHALRSIKLMALTMVPICIVLVFAAGSILHIFGNDYANEATQSLQILTIVSLLSCINYLGDNILNAMKRVKLFTATNFFGALSTVIFVMPLMRFGLNGVAFGWLLSEVSTVVLYLFIFKKQILNLVMNNKVS
jgi:O-antigen/teichoic acid export membrane protein